MKKRISITLTTVLCLICMLVAGCASVPAETDAPKDTVSSVSDVSPTDEVTSPADVPQSDEQVSDERYIELSGDAEDVFTAEYNCYTEGEQVVICFQKGCEIRGDMIDIAEKVMEEVAGETGMSFEKNYEPEEGYTSFLNLYEMADLSDINADHEKINIYVVELGNSIQWAVDNSIIVESADFDYEESSYGTLYHELTHTVHLRNGVSLGGTLNEGYAVYHAYEAQKKNNMRTWSMIQFYGQNDLFDDSIIADGEDAFWHMFDDGNFDYQYGYRFVTFLYEKYGDSAFTDILKDATARHYNDAYGLGIISEKEADNEQLKQIIKSNTSEDVFDQFADWYYDNWNDKAQEYWDYMDSIGLGW